MLITNKSKIITLTLIITAVFYLNYRNGNPAEISLDYCTREGFGSSRFEQKDLSIEQQKLCSKKLLEIAGPIEMSVNSIGNLNMQTIELLAKGSVISVVNGEYKTPLESLTFCYNSSESNAERYGCLIDTELFLQEILRSLVVVQIEEERKISTIANDTSPDLYADIMKEYWTNWYTSSTIANSRKSIECQIEGTKALGSYNPQIVSECYIETTAKDILWLINKQKERTEYFEERWDEILDGLD